MSEYNPNKDIKKMIDKYVAGTATAEEVKFVELYYTYLENNKTAEISDIEAEELSAAIYDQINHHIYEAPKRSTIVVKLYKYASVAAVLLLVSISAYLFFKPVHQNLVVTHKTLDIAPGSSKAMLTLANGTKIILDDKTNGDLKPELAGLKIAKTRKGQLVYTVLAKPQAEEINTNTVTTPRGGQYQIILSDDTKVWLNAASSLTYPEVFAGTKRVVKLQGEGYFEVAKNKAMPFHVETENQDVEVTGTHFNINSYLDDNTIKTTLLEGSVTIHSAGNIKKLYPGQQALVFTNKAGIEINPVSTEEEVAWKNGLFQFNNASLKNILSQLERWYNIRVDYNTLPLKHYNGMVPRSANLSAVLKMLELTGNIQFKIEDNRQLRVISN